MLLSREQIESLITRFEQTKLPREEWTHEAHLIVAVWYVDQLGWEDALPVVRTNITSHNAVVGTPNTDSQGYHESITRLWLILAQVYINSHKKQSLVEKVNGFIAQSDLSKSSIPLQYYSEDLLFSTKARRRWVEPDLRPLPSLEVNKRTLEEIEHVENELRSAMLRSDIFALENLLSDRLRFVTPKGHVINKQDDLDNYGQGMMCLEELTINDRSFEVISKHLVESKSLVFMKGVFDGQAFEGHFVWSKTWNKQKGFWQVLYGSNQKSEEED